MTLPANKIENVRRRVNRARRFPDNTCPASRHMHGVADMWARGQSAEEAYGWNGNQDHLAGSLYSVLESLFKARTELAKLKALSIKGAR